MDDSWYTASNDGGNQCRMNRNGCGRKAYIEINAGTASQGIVLKGLRKREKISGPKMSFSILTLKTLN